ncbi:hypothetical protein KUV85_04825 [Nocardioides panacisoli]|uniref:hypothetical protein n=1 Tax=Nocardioides panacisoli TaxID=627624 RepID=UPI001C636E7C|nr:hypothetical protein [Nocardioides panacisoli]QYJ05013.1 hypothetical protein KUV85_04825 [Nocardioides panacisoli]
MEPVTGLSLGRIAIGAVALLSPRLAAKLFLLDGSANPQLPYMTRLFGAREVALGAATLTATGTAQRNLVAIGVAVDAADVATGVVGAQRGEVGRVAGGGLSAIALGAVGAGIAALALARKG